MPRKYSLGTAPFLRQTDEKTMSTKRMMTDVVICTIPLILFAWVKNGLIPFIKVDGVSVLAMLWPLIFVLTGVIGSILFEAVYFYCFKKIREPKALYTEVKNSYAMIPGLLLTLCLPLYTPLWVILVGCFFANILFKMLFGGFGYNIFNPALIAYVLVITAFTSVIPTSDTTGIYLNPYEDLQITTSATPLTNYSKDIAGDYNTLVAPYGNLGDFFIGTIPGSIGETSALLCLLAFIYLVIRKTINWYVPVIYIGTVFAITMIIGFTHGHGLWYPLFNIFSGGLFFGAVFMATEPVTTPRSPNGRVIFAFALGVLTSLFRLVGAMPEGVATSILFLCLLTPLIDLFAAKLRIEKNPRQLIIKYAAVFLLLAGIAGYTIYKCSPAALKGDEAVQIEIMEVLE